LGKTYRIELWEHWEPREHIENLMGIHWELEGKMLRTKKKNLKIKALWVHAEPFPLGFGVMCFFGGTLHWRDGQ
jgi:hypothetical protein